MIAQNFVNSVEIDMTATELAALYSNLVVARQTIEDYQVILFKDSSIVVLDMSNTSLTSVLPTDNNYIPLVDLVISYITSKLNKGNHNV